MKFYKWNTEYSKNYIFETVGNEYALVGESNGFNKKSKIIHNICGYSWDISIGKFSQGRRCPKCRNIETSKRCRETFESLYKKISSITNGEFELIDAYDYTDNRSKILIRHEICGNVFEIVSANFLFRKKCKFCQRKKRRKSNAEFLAEIERIYGRDYIPQETYKKAKTKIKVLHSLCKNSWSITPDNLLRGYGCPFCSESKGEKRVSEYLKILNIPFEFQKTFDDCKRIKGYLFKFDFYIPQFNLIIEFHGEQHYLPVDIFGGLPNLKEIKERDKIKKEYCKSKKIYFLEISYANFDIIENIINKKLSMIQKRKKICI